MKNLTVVSFACLLLSCTLPAQTLIATSNHPNATANHNQRKIVRDTADNVYVVYQDIFSNDTVIMGVFLNRETGIWCEPFQICEGKNPTLAISNNCKIFLVFESCGNISDIIYRSSHDFISWSSNLILDESEISCIMPIADVDQTGSVNVFWLINVHSNQMPVIYALVQNDTVSKYENFFGIANDIAVANQLKYENSNLFIAMESSEVGNEIFLYCTDNYWQTFMGPLIIDGCQPTLTVNSYYDSNEQCLKLLYLNEQGKLFEAISVFEDFYMEFDYRQVQFGNITYYCIDDLAPPIGNSYLFMRDNNFYHSFSLGSVDWFSDDQNGIYYDYDILLDSVTTNPINPSIAYKHFRFDVVDFIWTEAYDETYRIFYKRDDKYNHLTANDQVPQKQLTIYASPNPFHENVVIDFSSIKTKGITKIIIFDSKGTPILSTSTDKNSFLWDACDNSGSKVKSGNYIVLTENNGRKVAGRIIKL